MEAFREGLYMSWNSLMTALCYCLLTLVWKRLTLKMNPHLFYFFFFSYFLIEVVYFISLKAVSLF